MTTRRAAKTSSNHTSPAAPSSAASGSRRSSLNDVAQQSDFDDEPAKRSRMSTDTGSPNGSFGNNTPMNGTQTPDLDEPVAQATLQASKTAAKRRRASDESTQSSKTRSNGVLTGTQSDVSEQQPRRKKRKTTDALANSADQPPELTDASTAPNSPEQVPDVAISLSLQNVLSANGDAPAKIPKRLPGRRRQPHPDTNVEVDLRRQLSLKTSYRSVAKVLKGVLDELAQRTTKNLQDDPEHHKQCPEYGPLMAGLDQKRDVQLDHLAAWRSERVDQLERLRIAEEQSQKQQYIVSCRSRVTCALQDTNMAQNRFEDLRDDCLQRCYFRMKQMEREWKAAQDDATDDEVRPACINVSTYLTVFRTMCCPPHILMIQSRVPMNDSAPNSRHVAERTSRLIGNLKTTSGGSDLIKSVPPSLRRMRMQTTQLRNSLAALLALLDQTVPKQLRITTSSVLQMPPMISRGRHRRKSESPQFKFSRTIRRLCLCCWRIFRSRSPVVRPLRAERTKVNLIICRKHRLSLNSNQLDISHLHLLALMRRRSCPHKPFLRAQHGQYNQF